MTDAAPQAAVPEEPIAIAVQMLDLSTRSEPVTTSQYLLVNRINAAVNQLVELALEVKSLQPAATPGAAAVVHPVEGAIRQALATASVVSAEQARSLLLRLVAWPDNRR